MDRFICSGIEVVRTRVKMFAQKKVSLPQGAHKIIILDEADSMTAAAQQALRRTMELYSATTRFALSCNNSSKIIEPIQSRCAILRYTRLSEAQVTSRILAVIDAEKITHYTNDGLEALVFTCDGDLRAAINNLQSTFSGFGNITATTVFKVCDQPSPVAIKICFDDILNGKLEEALDSIAEVLAKGFAAIDVIQTMFKVAKGVDMKEKLKLEFIREIGNTHMKIAEGIDSPLQIYACFSRMYALSMNHQ